MAGKGGLGVIIGIGALAVGAGAKFVYDKITGLKTELKAEKTKNELNEKIIDSQKRLLEQYENKLEGKGSK